MDSSSELLQEDVSILFNITLILREYNGHKRRKKMSPYVQHAIDSE
jgi:hypothetical protein